MVHDICYTAEFVFQAVTKDGGDFSILYSIADATFI